MHPVLIAYRAQLLLNPIFCDIYIRQAQNFSVATGARTGSGPIIIPSILAVEEPGSRMFKNGTNGLPQQIYSLSISFPLVYLGSNELKLNDFVALSTRQAPLLKKRYEIKQIDRTNGLLATLRLLEHTGERPGLTYSLFVSDQIAWSEAAIQTL